MSLAVADQECKVIPEQDGNEVRPPRAGPRTSHLAVVSLTIALVSFVLWVAAGMPAPLVAAIAVVLGLFGRRDIRRSRGRLKGTGVASAGLRFGVLHLVLYGFYWFLIGPYAF
jgi:hypothetical protein